MPSPVSFTVWSDFLCPWCFVGAVRIADLKEEFGDRLLVTWKSYLLRPEAQVRPLDTFRNYTTSWSHPSGPGAHESRTVFNEWGDETPPSHSVPPAIAGKVAASFGADAFDRFHHALMAAYFTDNRTISDIEVIVDVAAACDLDPNEFRSRMQHDGARLHREVFDDMSEGVDLGVHAAPTVVVNQTLPIPGAQDLDSYRMIVERILARP